MTQPISGAQIVNGRPAFVIGGVAYHNIVQCKYCGKQIVFVPTASGKAMPINSNGASHFATCEPYQQRKRTRKAHRSMLQPGLFE